VEPAYSFIFARCVVRLHIFFHQLVEPFDGIYLFPLVAVPTPVGRCQYLNLIQLRQTPVERSSQRVDPVPRPSTLRDLHAGLCREVPRLWRGWEAFIEDLQKTWLTVDQSAGPSHRRTRVLAGSAVAVSSAYLSFSRLSASEPGELLQIWYSVPEVVGSEGPSTELLFLNQ
jgi:hypothetical protein